MTQDDIRKILNVGVLLSSERNLNRLLEKILISVMEISHCDAGTLYLLNQDRLHFTIMRNDTLKVYQGGDGQRPDIPPVQLSSENVCALALIEGRTINIPDVRNCHEYDLTGPTRYDAMTGYHTQSMLAVPMQNRRGEKIGVLQLINAKDADRAVCPFSDEMALVLESVASQAAITIQNVRYIEEIQELFHSFVRVFVSAVEERSPYNASHTKHMVTYGERFLDYLNMQAEMDGGQAPFDAEHREELLMSIWLHDIGKLVIPLEIMDKQARLLPEQHSAFLHRMETLCLLGEIDALSGKENHLNTLTQDIKNAEKLVESVNTAGFVTDEKIALLRQLTERTYIDRDGNEKHWLTENEYEMLSIRKGTLSDEERRIMQSHVVMTDKLLSQIHFSRELSHVREWAASHHEYLAGDGYPEHLSGDEIPPEVRILTIIDIFDALTADDRPYKPGMPPEKALSVLKDMAEKENRLDKALVEQFAKSRCWEQAGMGKGGGHEVS